MVIEEWKSREMIYSNIINVYSWYWEGLQEKYVRKSPLHLQAVISSISTTHL